MLNLIKGNPIMSGIIGLMLIVAVLGLLSMCSKQDAGEEANLVNQGAIIERDASKSEVINHVQEARDAVDDPTPAERNVVCSKYDRNCPDGQ